MPPPRQSPRPGPLQQAQSLLRAGQPDKAVALLERASAKDPRDAQTLALLARLLAATGRHDQAAFRFERLVALRPADPAPRAALAEQLLAAGRESEAEKTARQLPDLGPAAASAAGMLASVLLSHDRHECARLLGDWAHATAPADARTAGYCAAARAFTGDHAGAAEALRSTDEHRRTDPDLQRDTLLLMLYCPQFSPREVFEAHRRYGELVTARLAPALPPPRDRDPDRPLRVGYISQDFRNRSAGHFIEGIVEHHDRASVLPFCYSHRLREDELTARVRTAAAGFTEIHRLDDRQAAQRIAADGIDIAVDLTGHTGLNRVGVLAHAPAAVQCTYMGYAATTGLPTIGYRFVDAHTDPAPEADALATEELIRLDPCFLCYTPPPHAPEPSPCPSDPEGPNPQPDPQPVTFASFNTFAKITDDALSVWADILARVPGSRLLVKNAGLKDPWLADRFRERFAAAGGDPARLETMGETPTAAEHMALYARVDVALDTFPYNGTTTTLEAMWMGVPVVTVAGDAHVSRVGVSLLRNTGLPGLVAESPADYAAKAAALAADLPRRRELRRTLRETVRTNLCDFASFVPALESVYRDLWRRAIAGRG